ncbi:zonular occludens toxin domain-containing protein [Acinetobacter junii]|uniref:Zonular occludens toxin domain-containing protein n=1 Tax=Acinetobacter junii TaxID=40215 RepID=A0ABU8ZM36_ACIJU
MAIYLIVGQPRHGKSQFAAKMAYEYHEKNIEIQKRIDSGKFNPETDIVREIYSDIEGHAEKCDFIKPAPKDWRDVPDNSIIFMDEIHKRPEYTDNDGKMSQNPMIVDLTTHGHHNKDIILMTQDPQRLNKGIRALVEKMYLVKRPVQKPNFATIYEFERWLRDPWQAAASTRSVNYQDSYKFFYKKKWQDMYTSASAHTSIQFKIQSKFIYAIIAIVVLMSLSWVLFTKSGGDKLARNAIGGMTGQKPTEQAKPLNAIPTATTTTQTDLSTECRKGVNVEKPECVAWFNEITKNGSSVATGDNGRTTVVAYNPTKPFDDSIQKNITYEVTSKPVFSGCTKFGSKYQAYTQQGTKLDVSQADCQRLIENNDRPFNYFANNRSDMSSTEMQRSEISTQTNQPKI